MANSIAAVPAVSRMSMSTRRMSPSPISSKANFLRLRTVFYALLVSVRLTGPFKSQRLAHAVAPLRPVTWTRRPRCAGRSR